jgi:hypothetical protein
VSLELSGHVNINIEVISSRFLPNHRNNDVSDCEGSDKGPDGGGDSFSFAVGEGESQDDEDKEQLDRDLSVIGQWPFHGIGVVQGVAKADKGDSGNGGG